MASARKKQDEKNLKILRELVSLPGNKHCFDCNQRGPTYVNMTIGSFVCTKCSGMLRGLTPPHRVKSISMASFTCEEVEWVRCSGNDLCRATWLALLEPRSDAVPSGACNDEQQVKDFMLDKYERKRYYHDKGARRGAGGGAAPHTKSDQKITHALSNGSVNGNTTTSSPASNDFVADFGSADIFNAGSQFNNNVTTTQTATTQPSFANFDNNVIFDSATSYPSSYDLLVSQLQLSQMQIPRCAIMNRWNMTSPPMNGVAMNGISSGFSSRPKPTPPPSEDRYAALKDLDNALKSQQEQQQTQVEWGSNGSGYASPSTMYGSPGQSTMFGSPSQGSFITSFQQDHTTSNPFTMNNGVNNGHNNSFNNGHSNSFNNGHNNSFNNGHNNSFNNSHNNSFNNSHNNGHSTSNGVNGTRNPWAINGNNTVIANNNTTTTATASFSSSPNGGANPFRDSFSNNKFSNGFQQQSMFQNSSHFNKPWANPNPFTLGVSPGAGGSSNNPFL